MAICVAAGTFTLVVAANAFTLAWNHSVEKIRWEEDYRVRAATLVLEAARVRGSGAGMEPPMDAVLRDGVYHYRPKTEPVPRLSLANTKFGGAYELCVEQKCEKLPSEAPVTIEVCTK